MAQDNIYDLIISELILRLDATTAANQGAPGILITSNLASANEAAENSNQSVVFSSTVQNIPTNYTVQASSHTMEFPSTVTSPDVTGSTDTITGTDSTVILGAIGSTYTVTSTVILEDLATGGADITLVSTYVITSVLPIYYGVKAAETTATVPTVPDTTGLLTAANSATYFQMTTSIVGRLFVVIPTTNSALLTITGPNGLIIPISDFTATTVGSLVYYELNYDTQLTGSNLKTFTLNYV